MEEKNLLIVTSILQARNFPHRPDCCLVVEGRLGGEVLSTDLFNHSSGLMEVDTELAWEMSRKAFQQHKLQRTPIKLLCYAVNSTTHKKQSVGYVLLDLRTAQQVTEPQSHWYGLLNSQYSGLRPELHVSLSVEKDSGPPHTLPAREGGATYDQGEAPQILTLTLDHSGGYYTLGPPSAHKNMFTLSLTLDNPRNVPLPPSPGCQWYFYYNLLGNDITSEPFIPLNFRPERASVRVKSTRDLFGTLLAAQEDLQLYLCCGDQSEYNGVLSLKTLSSSDTLQQTVGLTPQQRKAQGLSPPTVDVTVQVDIPADHLSSPSAHSVPPHTSTALSVSKPDIAQTEVPSTTQTTSPPLIPTSSSSNDSSGHRIPTDHRWMVQEQDTPGKQADVNSRGSSSVKRNLTHSFDEVVQPTSCNDDVLKAGNHGLPSSGPVLTHAHLLTSTTQINVPTFTDGVLGTTLTPPPCTPTSHATTGSHPFISHTTTGGHPLISHATTGGHPLTSHTTTGGHPLTSHTTTGGHPLTSHTTTGGHPLTSHATTGGHPLTSHATTGGHPLISHATTGGHPLTSHTTTGGHPLTSHTTTGGHPFISHTTTGGHPLTSHATTGGHPFISHTTTGGHPLISHTTTGGHPLTSHTATGGHPFTSHVTTGRGVQELRSGSDITGDYHKPSHTSHSTSASLAISQDSSHHFRFSIDIHSLHNVQMGSALRCFLKYSYPFFGCPYPVMVHPPVAVPPNTEQQFSQSYCAFDFATSLHQLVHQLHSQPLNVEVWHSHDQNTGTQDQLVGSAKVPLSEVLSSEKVIVGSVTRQVCSLRIPVTPPHSPHVITGYLHSLMVLEDHGAIQVTKSGEGRSLAGTGYLAGNQESLPLVAQAPIPPDSVEYRAALELEMWKLVEEEAFQQQLRGKEAAHMTQLADEWQKRDQQRQQLLKQKLDRYTELEKQLQDTLRELQEQQHKVKLKETELSQDRDRLSQECQALQAEADRAVQQTRTECEKQLELERLRVHEFQLQVARLTKQVSDLEQKCASKDVEFEAYRKQLLSKPESRLQAEISMLQLEKGEVDRKLSAAVKSKQHYKEQWSKALRELAAVRQREQVAARERLRRQQEELEVMRTQFLQQGEQHSIGKQLSEVKSEVNRLQEQTLVKTGVNSQDSKELPTEHIAAQKQTPPTSITDKLDSDVARWIEERDILLQTGVYTSTDPTIQRLDHRIREALTQQTLK